MKTVLLLRLRRPHFTLKIKGSFAINAFLLSAILFLNAFSVSASEFNNNCRRAYELLLQYDLPEASKLIENEKANGATIFTEYLESYHDLLKVFFNESKYDYERMQKAESERELFISNSTLKSPYKKFCLAEVYVHDALARLKFGDNLSAAYKIKTAYGLLDELRTKYPKFLPANKDLLMFEAAIGTLPATYRTMLSILGFSGNLKKSMASYKSYLSQLDASDEYRIFSKESRVYHSFMNYYLLNNPDAAWQEMQIAASDYELSALSAFFRATMAMRTRRNAEMVNSLKKFTSNPPIHQLSYFYGIARLQQLDVGGGYYLSNFVRSFAGQGYIKDAYLKLGWAFLLKGDTASYRNCRTLVSKFGTARFEEDKNALRESRKNTPPDMHLLRARLLYDGGLYERARAELQSVEISYFKTKDDKAESQYRLGRIFEGLGNDKEALKYYDNVVKNYSVENNYFPPASCLYIAMIYEKQKNFPLAKQYFQKCQQYKNYPYEDSFNQKANAGLKRLE